MSATNQKRMFHQIICIWFQKQYFQLIVLFVVCCLILTYPFIPSNNATPNIISTESSTIYQRSKYFPTPILSQIHTNTTTRFSKMQKPITMNTRTQKGDHIGHHHITNSNITLQLFSYQHHQHHQHHENNESQNNESHSMMISKQWYPNTNWRWIYFQHIRKSGGTSIDLLFYLNKFCGYKHCDNCLMFKKIGYHKHCLQKRDMIKNQTLIENAMNKTLTHDGNNNNNTNNNNETLIVSRVINREREPFPVSEYLSSNKSIFDDTLLLTIVRDPIQRIWSDLFWRMIWSYPCSNLSSFTLIQNDHKQLENDTILLECINMKFMKWRYSSNVYTKVFSETGGYALVADAKIEHAHKGILEYFDNVRISEKHLNIAKNIINDFDVILILELWNQTRIQLKCAGFEKYEELPHENNKRFNIDINKHEMVKNELIKLNQYDIQFYQYCKQLALKKSQQCKEYLDSQQLQ